MSRWVIDTPHGEFRPRVALGCAPRGEREAASAGDVWFFARGALTNLDPEAVAGALEMYGAIRALPFCRPDQMTGERAEMLAESLDHDVRGGIIRFDEAWARIGTVLPRTREKEAPKAAPSAVADTKNDFVDVVLVDEAGEPIVNELYELRMPDGEVIRGHTDRSGKAWAPPTVSGTCEISFPGLDRDAWEAA